jgi:hypothetical protein
MNERQNKSENKRWIHKGRKLKCNKPNSTMHIRIQGTHIFLKHNRCSLLDQNNHQDWKGKNVSTFGVLSCWQSKEIWLSKLKEEWFMWEWILIIPFFFLCFPTRNNISCGVELGRILFMWYQQWWHPSKC